MISLTRDRHSGSIANNFKEPRRSELSLRLLVDRRTELLDPLKKQKFNTSIWKQAKDQLKAEAKNKCAYCEAPTSLVAYGDVEHYRPKSKYWWLAYSYENYLLSCQLCNQKYKKAKFRVLGQQLQSPSLVKRNSTDSWLQAQASQLTPDSLSSASIQQFADLHELERPLLLNPYFDDPETYFAWRADENLKEVELAALPERPDLEPFVTVALTDLGLNRQELKTERYKVYEILRTFKEVINSPLIDDALKSVVVAQIERMKDESSAFSGMVRYFAKT